MQGKVEICGVNTSRLTVLSQAEMDMLLRRAKEGDTAAREKLIEGNLRLVLSVIQRFDKRGENPDDLFQVGCIGLIKAISNFDPDKQVRFSTYGVPMIAGEVRRYLRDNSAIRVSRSIRDVAYRVLQCKEALYRGDFRNAAIFHVPEIRTFFVLFLNLFPGIFILQIVEHLAAFPGNKAVDPLIVGARRIQVVTLLAR